METREYSANITPEEIAAYSLSWFKGEIAVVDSMEAFEAAMPRLAGEKLLGFDTETRPVFKKGHHNSVSLVQLSTATFAVLIRINRIGLPEGLLKILSDSSIIKAGVALHDDLRFLSGVRKFTPAGFIDLQPFVKKFGIESSGLKKLAAIVLGFRISKTQQVTNWEAEQLTRAQQIYAATDAWVCHEIYTKLMKEAG
ncbi:MAG: 3'-5' exonuclease domain-containing protein 2 [Bacteroidales bacterium]|jgi:ribonuclease D|nr:3'-5' exonuclease domain-containing protein 2 [Bacteroidales bacterium]